MPITIKHGAELEGKGLAYGAAAKAAYIKQQEDKQKKEQKKAKRLGNIGSALSTAGAIATFIPGLQPVGVGLSVAGGALGALSGGAGDPGGQAIAMSAQGISQIYQAQASKVEARQEEWDDWKRRKDYTNEISSIRGAERLDQEVEVANTEFIGRYRTEERSFVDKKNSVLEAVNLQMFGAFSLEEMDTALLGSRGPQSNAYQQVRPKLMELQEQKNSTIGQLEDIRKNDPAIRLKDANKQLAEKAEAEQDRLEQEQKTLERQEKREVDLAKGRASIIKSSLTTITKAETSMSVSDALEDDDAKKLGLEAYDAVMQQRNTAMAAVSEAVAEEIKVEKIRLANGDPDALMAGLEGSIHERTQELLAGAKEMSDKYAPKMAWKWPLEVAGLTAYYESIAKKELVEQIQANGTTVLDYLADMNVRNKYGVYK